MTLATVEPTVQRHTRRFWNGRRAESRKPSTKDSGWNGRNGRSLSGRSGRKRKTAGGSNSGKLEFGRERWLSVPMEKPLIGGFEIDRALDIRRFSSARVSIFGLQTISTLVYLGRYLNQYNSLRSIPVSSCDPHYSGDLPLRTDCYAPAINPRWIAPLLLPLQPALCPMAAYTTYIGVAKLMQILPSPPPPPFSRSRPRFSSLQHPQ